MVSAMALMVLLAQGVGDPPPAPGSTVITNPSWRDRPTGEDVERVFPSRAKKLSAMGHATIRCDVDDDGRLEQCVVLKESPAGLEFGAAALRLAQKFRLRPMLRDGVAVGGGSITIPIRFKPPQFGQSEVEAAPVNALTADGVSGSVQVECHLGLSRMLESCEAVKAEPAGLGPRAVALIKNVPAPKGAPIGLVIRFPLVFTPKGSPQSVP